MTLPSAEPLAKRTRASIDLDVKSFVLDTRQTRVRRLDTNVANSLIDGEIERTTDGASTLTVTVHDPRRSLLQSGAFEYAIDTRLDSLHFRLVKVQKGGDNLTLTFEDREVALLRQRSGARKAARSKMTRAEFALSLVREVRPAIKFVCPQLHQRQLVAGKGDARTIKRQLPFQFQRGSTDGRHEDSWTCLQRLAEEINWRCFASGGAVYFVSDDDLLAAPVSMTISETSQGVTSLDFDVDAGKVSSEVTLSARASRWSADPGDVVKLTNVGPANGLWLVHSMRRSLYDADATIVLRRATKPLREPAPALAAPRVSSFSTARVTSRGGGVSDASVDTSVERAYEAARAIDAKQFPYVWGGGHGGAGIPSGSPPGFDCSGSTVAVLAAAGFGFSPGGGTAVSGALASWGVAGRGQYLTVYANDVHVFMVFHTSRGDQHFGTGRWGKSWGGAGFNPSMHPTSGFAERHWPGT